MVVDADADYLSEDSRVSSVESMADPHVTHLRLALAPWIVHFQTPGYIKEETMQMLDLSVTKKALDNTRLNPNIRKELGTHSGLWKELGELLAAAVPSLEKRCFATTDPASPEFDVLSGQLIAANCISLLKDLERLNSMVCIGRNILTIGDSAQSLAAQQQFDQEVFKLINICIKVTARGYDGEPGSGEEDKWQSVINSFKKLLITCLQFINNLVARNERRKLMLWVELFDCSSDNALENASGSSSTALPSASNSEYDEEFKKNLISISKGIHIQSEAAVQPNKFLEPASSPFILYIGRIGWEVKKELLENKKPAGAAEVATECQRRWQALSEEDRKVWDEMFTDVVRKYRKEVPKFVAEQEDTISASTIPALDSNASTLARSIQKLQIEVNRMKKSIVPLSPSQTDSDSSKLNIKIDMNSYISSASEVPDPSLPQSEDFEMDISSKYGADILQQGKDDLLRRLESYNDRAAGQPTQMPAENPPRINSPGVRVSQEIDDGADLSDEEDSDEDDYVIPGDDGRGLLTDVPLILGPTEIEVLPMIIMSGIVPPLEGTPGFGDDPNEISAIKHMHTIRCHLLLAQENGRNLLRELLIFVAAWDLREDELYFKFMVKIMEAILTNGLMPFSYHAFKESKDIISPAQAVIMKLLTNIFRQRQSIENANKAGGSASRARRANQQQAYPMQVDVQMVKFLLTEFRRNIIPQTCALIFLQGQIRAGYAAPDDFPLNLWDMERMYEGVYQYLEFFAILTEADVWKTMMANWDITSELVTLLKELDAAIPKGQLPGPPILRQHNNSGTPGLVDHTQASASNGGSTKYTSASVTTEPGSIPIAIERPYDLSASDSSNANTAPASTAASNPMPPGPFITDVSNFSNASPTDEPSDFEWRNLKKLTVLVLSSLTWHSHKVQDQVREHDGIHAVLNCCAYDEHNPYIREHAIMCLRFLLEGNRPNQDVVRELEARGVVPNEVLDQHGYETFMDSRGQVGLRRKVAPAAQQQAATTSQTHQQLAAAAAAATHAAAIASGASSSDAALLGASAAAAAKSTNLPKDPRDIAELVQQVMRDLPTRVQGARAEAERAAVAKLDKGFEGGG